MDETEWAAHAYTIIAGMMVLANKTDAHLLGFLDKAPDSVKVRAATLLGME